MLKKFCTLIAVIACVIGIAGCAWGGVSLSAFPDPAFREYLKQNCDTGWLEYDSAGRPYMVGCGDGILDDKEICRINTLYLEGYSITSLKGIEYITTLDILFAGSNQIQAIDVSYNTALTELFCGDNQLTVLDVSKNIALKVLCCDSNKLTAL
ncbi:MAG: hypothetical protein II964_05930, partial [Synergistaceae bacterium]|nr:hypothetical protein [Synergistaceae bacterium]